MNKSVIVAGGGVMGLSLAYTCRRQGWEVTVFEKGGTDFCDSCSHYAGGMLAPFCELESAEPEISLLGLRSMELFGEWLPTFSRPVFYQEEGSLVVAHHGDLGELGRLERRVQSSSLPHGMKRVSAPEIQELEPGLEGRFRQGLYFPHEGQISPRELLPALVETLVEMGCQLHFDSPVVSLEPGKVLVHGQEYRADWVLDCRGLAAQTDMTRLRGVKGEMVLLRTEEVQLRRPVRMMHPRFPIYIVPRPDHVFMVGATTIESEDSETTTVRSLLELLSAAYALHPSFGEAAVLETNAGARPAFPNHLPGIERVEEGLLRVNGLYRHGFLISPAMAEVVTTYLSTGEISAPHHYLWRHLG